MTVRRSSALAALVVALAMTVAACGDSGDDTSGGDSSGLKVAMVLPGAINDKGFNQTGYEGLQQCEDAGATTTYKEMVPVPEFEQTYETFSQDNDLVIGHGFEFGEIAAKVAPDFPDVDYVVTSNPLKPEQDNIEHLMPNSTQGAYLAGVVAGQATETNKLGGIFGFDFPVLMAQAKAFEAGAKSVNPDITFEAVYLGTFDDVAKGKEAAQSMAADGIDVIYHIADAAGIGVINGATEEGIYVIGWGADQNEVAPETVIASQIVDQAKMIGLACQAAVDGEFEGGGLVVDGLQSGVIDLSPVYNLPEDVQAKVDEVKQQIIDGEVEVPSVGGGIPGSGEGSG
ncbi:MAG: BMP family ABC transporter substrate-binding protein [Acidobacteria bacterium]|nr:MAG: BMP family ABC transporter substrate-binding protein [Acidobacteriota bacterium]MCL4286129.1 BMP family protein [Thermoleophilia bacterium]GIK77286.1 MAG: BMP family ABC transporter substrate-binding protein [Actinomycetes bacterium]